jgi:hypothetical protein
MGDGLENLPKAKWGDAGRQVILKQDFVDVEAALPQLLTLLNPPNFQWVDVTAVQVAASTDTPAKVLMIGFPDMVNHGQFINGGLTDNKYRVNTGNALMDFDVAASLWGTEKASQWYAVLAIAGDADTDFDLKAMPFLRVKSQATQTISLGTLTTPATGRGYGFTTNEFIGSKIYVMTGASAGLIRAISANNNDNTTGGTITYTGDSLTLAEGDWLIILPNTNFRWVGDVLNDSGSSIEQFVKAGNAVTWCVDTGLIQALNSPNEDIRLCSPLARLASIAASRAGYEVAMGHPDASSNLFQGPGGDSTDFAATIQVRFCQYKLNATTRGAIGYFY